MEWVVSTLSLSLKSRSRQIERALDTLGSLEVCFYTVEIKKKMSEMSIDTGCVTKNLTLYKNACQQSWQLESGHLYACFSNSCLMTKTKLKMETFWNELLMSFKPVFFVSLLLKFWASDFCWLTLYMQELILHRFILSATHAYPLHIHTYKHWILYVSFQASSPQCSVKLWTQKGQKVTSFTV